jgi:hypothetical protein
MLFVNVCSFRLLCHYPSCTLSLHKFFNHILHSLHYPSHPLTFFYTKHIHLFVSYPLHALLIHSNFLPSILLTYLLPFHLFANFDHLSLFLISSLSSYLTFSFTLSYLITLSLLSYTFTHSPPPSIIHSPNKFLFQSLYRIFLASSHHIRR